MLGRTVGRLVITHQTLSVPVIGRNIVRVMSGKFGPEDIGIKKLGTEKDPKQVTQSEWKKVLPPESLRGSS
ncbi:hypothetical protein KIN20_015765 [Parelaphostrongylus tenuis]|uniref:Uncharacterized protein n=1 Tax=Parelaphostrongylus tenuis TaxID=148309 RepID=A0AAD5N0P8_PARTN|nr:hypothetical protein KIN20_015765 [Parelaphostrongylus tenuis]